jgi:nicotinamidase-related amidase
MSTPVNLNSATPIIDPANATMLLIDHQSGPFQTIQDMPFTEVRTNATILAKVASLANIPVITSASVPPGPNGPLIPNIHKYAPHAQYVARRGGEGHPQEAAHHRRHHHQRLHGLPQHRRRA